MIRNPINAATSAWREASDLIHISPRRLWVLAALGAAVGLAETVFLAILASVGVALAGNTEVSIKLPIGSIESPPMPLLLGLGAVAVLLTLGAQFLIVIGMARINSRVVVGAAAAIYYFYWVIVIDVTPPTQADLDAMYAQIDTIPVDELYETYKQVRSQPLGPPEPPFYIRALRLEAEYYRNGIIAAIATGVGLLMMVGSFFLRSKK